MKLNKSVSKLWCFAKIRHACWKKLSGEEFDRQILHFSMCHIFTGNLTTHLRFFVVVESAIDKKWVCSNDSVTIYKDVLLPPN